MKHYQQISNLIWKIEESFILGGIASECLDKYNIQHSKLPVLIQQLKFMLARKILNIKGGNWKKILMIFIKNFDFLLQEKSADTRVVFYRSSL